MKPILEAIPLGKEKTIHGFHYQSSDFETPWHLHPQYELTYIEESVGTKFIGDFVGFYEPGELVLLRSNLPHCWKNVKQKNGNATSIVFQWNKGIFPKIPELNMVFDVLRASAKGLLFDKVQTAKLLPHLQQLLNLQGHELYIQLLQVLTKLATYSYQTLSEKSFIDDLPSEYGTRMSTVHDFVSDNYNRKIYLKEVADIVHMSEQSFSRFFTKMMGRSFFTFLNEYRINTAVRLLLDTDNSVSQIGYSCGYESLPFFHKQFTKFVGCSPLVYQKRYKARRL